MTTPQARASRQPKASDQPADGSPRCTLNNPAIAITMDPSSRYGVWHATASRHGIQDLRLTTGILPSELPSYVPHAVLRKLNESSLLPPTLRQARKHLALWCLAVRFHSGVVAANQSWIFLEDDARLQPGFCGSVTRILRALPSLASGWDWILFGHCAESVGAIRQCQRVAPDPALERGTRRLWLTKGVYPMCGHALIVSPRGAARWLQFMQDWPEKYVERVLQTAVRGWELPGTARRRRPEKRPVDEGVDGVRQAGRCRSRGR